MTIYHITSKDAWLAAQAQNQYRAPSLETQGFIHCSTAHQVTRVADALFARRPGLVLLHIDPARLTVPVVYENLEGGTEAFPHVYGPIDLEAVVAVSDFTPDADGRFGHHLARLNDWERGRRHTRQE